ncbi:hypothetical protein [Novosphingobium sp. BW1]|uniref:hypothetical protein n=1 Tax=Novosphingobium sp. BW1 TaxID=2592621 RepID=UPI0011DEA514|nr:hypothetical protein [Novosphingobium sp. BW1]TYC85046.1 hypothetical protein FMM79_18300 [Novosphingobium sp. BW1]
MERPPTETHIDEDAARGGSTPHIVRYVLGISLALAIIGLSLAWMTGALLSGEEEETSTSGANAQSEMQAPAKAA